MEFERKYLDTDILIIGGAVFGGHDIANAVRYFLMVLAAGCVWPLTFRFFERYAK